MIELLFLVGGLATGVLAGLWSAHHLPAHWRASTAPPAPRPEPAWKLDARALALWERGVPGAVFLGAGGATFKDVTMAPALPSIPEAPPPVDVQALSPPKARPS
jgi:hypothetical protein